MLIVAGRRKHCHLPTVTLINVQVIKRLTFNLKETDELELVMIPQTPLLR